MEHSIIDKYLDRLEDIFEEMVRRLHGELANQMVSGITGSQFFVLKKIGARGPMTVSEVADELGVSLSAVTTLADRLAKSGFLKRTRGGKDRRTVWLEVTDKGKEILKTCAESRRKVAAKYLGQLPEADLERLIEIYEKILALIRAEKAQPAG